MQEEDHGTAFSEDGPLIFTSISEEKAFESMLLPLRKRAVDLATREDMDKATALETLKLFHEMETLIRKQRKDLILAFMSLEDPCRASSPSVQSTVPASHCHPSPIRPVERATRRRRRLSMFP